ncbi:rcc01693 family protein [Pararhodobacter sp. CCB-MM2]|uniref:rcc01693 family protein n=1 Tax=Pararhodobacter sp. CCB-MM2 TaxID=1786003 RepID=UPI0009F5FB1B
MTRGVGALDWPGLMRAGLHGLGLRPAEFWALTPAELMIMLGRDGAARPGLTRARLDALMGRFPDKGAAKGGGNGQSGRVERTAGGAGDTDRGDLGPGGGLRFQSRRHGPQPR